MGNWDQFDDDDDNDQPDNSGKGLRAQLKQALAAMNELKEENSKLRTESRASSLQEVLKGKSLDPRLAGLMARDEVDSSDESAVDGWLDRYGLKPSAPSGGQSSNDEGAAQLAAIRAAEQNALPSEDQMAEITRRIQESDGSPAAINAIVMGLR